LYRKKFKGRIGMKYRSYEKCQDKKREDSGKKVIGIDPAKEKHQAVVVKLASNINMQDPNRLTCIFMCL
jgi:hypothetical protein